MQSELLLTHSRYQTEGCARVKVTEEGRRLLGEAVGKLVGRDGVNISCVCGEYADQGITRVDRHGLTYPLFLCKSCGIIRMNPQPNEEELVWYYSNLYRPLYNHTNDLRELFQSKLWKGDLVQNTLIEAGLSSKFTTVLDLGCGGGWGLKKFHDAGMECIGFDYSEELIEFGNSQGLDLRMGGIDDAIAAGMKGDLVIFSHVLEHVRDPGGELQKLKGLLADGGLLYLETPSIKRIKKRLFGDSLRYWQRAHLWEFQLEHVSYFVRKVGLSVLFQLDDGDSCYVICRDDGVDEIVSFPRLGLDVRDLILGFEKQRVAFSTTLVRAWRGLRSFIGRLLGR